MEKYRNKEYIIEALQYTKEIESRFNSFNSEEDVEVTIKEVPEAKFTLSMPDKKLLHKIGDSLMKIEIGDYIVSRWGGYIVWRKEYFEKYYEKIE